MPNDGSHSIGRDFVISESNHRISNNLALLASAIEMRAADVVKNPEIIDREGVSLILHEVSARISTVAWLHRFLSQQTAAESIDINDHLYELCETLLSALSDPERMTLVKAGCGQCMVGVRKVIPLCLIVTEVVTNSLKYAHPTGVPGTIVVGCHETSDGSLVVEVTDDGVGMPENFDFLTQGGTGARTIRVLAKQLEAQVSYASAPIGSRFTLVVPA